MKKTDPKTTKGFLVAQAEVIREMFKGGGVTCDLIALKPHDANAIIQFAIASAQNSEEFIEALFEKWDNVIEVACSVGERRVMTIVFDMDGLEYV